MMPRSRCRVAFLFVASLLAGLPGRAAQQPDSASIIQHIDAAIRARFDHVLSFTVIEHYSVYHHSEQSPPVAQMTVKTRYQRTSGKTYTILAQSGSSMVRKMVLDRLLENERKINDPAEIEKWWFTSANYEMKVQPGGPQPIDGHLCYLISMTPRRSAPNLLRGTMWVDAKGFYTVRIEGVSSRSPSIFTGPSQMMRQYALVDGYEQATHARAVSNSVFFGRAIITIDYSNYQVQFVSNR